MATHSSTVTWKILWATIHGVTESDMTEPLSLFTLFTVLRKLLYYMDPYTYGHLEMTT